MIVLNATFSTLSKTKKPHWRDPKGVKGCNLTSKQLFLPFITYFHYLLLQDGTLPLLPSALIFARTFSHSKNISKFPKLF